MIKTYKNAKTQRVHESGNPKGFKGLNGERAEKVLDILAAADNLNALPALAGYRVHKLSGDRAGQWSITVNLPWSVCFTPSKDGWTDVEIVDYHKG